MTFLAKGERAKLQRLFALALLIAKPDTSNAQDCFNWKFNKYGPRESRRNY
jgi:hypothetical protein